MCKWIGIRKAGHIHIHGLSDFLESWKHLFKEDRNQRRGWEAALTNKEFDLPKELGLWTGRVRVILTTDYHKGNGITGAMLWERSMGDVKETKGARFSDCQDNMEGGTRTAFRLSPLPTGKVVLPGFILESLWWHHIVAWNRGQEFSRMLCTAIRDPWGRHISSELLQ